MKQQYSKADMIELIKTLDTRAEKLSDAKLDIILNMGFAELETVAKLFSGEEVIAMDNFYTSGETLITLDIEEDVSAIYDMYLTVENLNKDEYLYGIKQIRDKGCIYPDNRYMGRVHINLADTPEGEVIDNAVIKYFYVPKATNTYFYMDQPTYLATINAMGAALYDVLNDVARSQQKRAAMVRTATAITPYNPEDLIQTKPSMFPIGV